nr:uncharacterized protein LOC4341484 isoform X1 [Oryza sativa Japonica Group]
MARGPRRLRKLNLDAQSAGHVQAEEENLLYNFEALDEADAQFNDDNLHLEAQDAGNVQPTEDSEQDLSENDDIITELPLAAKRPINIIWPNGEVRQVLGNFNVKNLDQLKQGKVIVETDEHGIPNDRSGSVLGSYLGKLAQNSTFAPLDIPKWDHDLFVGPKESIVADVEMKFVYPSETKQLTRGWILMKADKGWRSYKSRLKGRYFNPDVRTLNDILKYVPKGVNGYQWRGLVKIWCQDKHKKLCEKNSESAKQQRNPHTTGRKSHARLCKEMVEAKVKGKVHDIDVWDEAHKKKDERIKAVVESAYHELAKKKSTSCSGLSSKDYDEVFRRVVGKETKLRGYYDHKNWSQIRVSQGLDVVGQSEEYAMLKLQMNAMENKIEAMSVDMTLMRAFIEQKFPGEDWRNIVVAEQNKEVDISEQVGNDIQHESNVEESCEHVHSTPDNVQLQQKHLISYIPAKNGCHKPSVPHEHMIDKQSSIGSFARRSEASQRYMESTMAHDHGTDKVDMFDQVDIDCTNEFDNNFDNSFANTNAKSNHVQQVHSISSANGNGRRFNPSIPYERTNAKQLSGESLGKRSITSQMNVESMVPRENVTNEAYVSEQDGTDIMNGFVHNREEPHANENAIPNNQLCSVSSTRAKENCSTKALPYDHITAKQSSIKSSVKRTRTNCVDSILPPDKAKQGPQRKGVLENTSSKSDQRVVFLFSLNPVYKGKVVAKGNLVTTDSTYVVGGNMLGNEYYGVAVHSVTNIGDERLPRPSENCTTLREAIGYVIPWPRPYVRKRRDTSSAQ